MKICRHSDIEKDFHILKRFAAPEDSLEAWERLFCLKGLREMPAIDAFPGFGERGKFIRRALFRCEKMSVNQKVIAWYFKW